MEPTSFVLDTGAEASVVDAQHAAANGITGSDSIARGNGQSTVSAQVIAGRAHHRRPAHAGGDDALRALWPCEGRALQAILGHDVLSHFVVARRRFQ